MKYSMRNLAILGSGIFIGITLVIGHGVWADRKAEETITLPLNDLRTFTEVFSKIKANYVEPVDDKVLLENAISGMLTGLDPHSAFLDAEAYKELRIGTTGEFGGLGIEVSMENGFVKVMSPIDDTPAQRGGVLAGDLIIRLDNTPVKGLTLKEAVDMMRGKPGTDIMLTIIREGQEKPLKITLTRAIIKVKSVKSRSLEPGYGYVRISQFQAHTTDNMLEAITALKKDNDGRLKGLVLDLRNNPGGVLDAAIGVSDAFLEKGLIVYTEGRVSDSQIKSEAKPSDVLNGAPIVVLVNSGSASASEIVAGALQDHKRAVIMGNKTFGKGSVQTIVPMGDGAALKLTTARYYTPSGRSIQAEGIVPDIVLENITVASVDKPEFDPIGEADLSGHLVNGKEKKNAEEGKSPGKGKESKDAGQARDKKEEESLAKSDYQLYEALNMLKGLHILQQKGK